MCKARHSKAIEGKGVYAQSEPNGLVRTVTARMAGDGIRTSMRKIALGLGSKFVDRTGALPSTRVCWRPEDEKEKKKGRRREKINRFLCGGAAVGYVSPSGECLSVYHLLRIVLYNKSRIPSARSLIALAWRYQINREYGTGTIWGRKHSFGIASITHRINPSTA